MTDAVPPAAESSTQVDYVALAPGRRVGRYEILSVLGQGGFGITYRARDTQLDRDVALKEYLPVALAVRQDGASVLPRSTEVAEDFSWGRDRFIEEGRTLATLHEAPSIVRVFDFLEENGTAYTVMNSCVARRWRRASRPKVSCCRPSWKRSCGRCSRACARSTKRASCTAT